MGAEQGHSELAPALALGAGDLVVARRQVDLVVVVIVASVEYAVAVEVFGVWAVAAFDILFVIFGSVDVAIIVLAALGVVFPVVPFGIIGRAIGAQGIGAWVERGKGLLPLG